MYWDHFKQRNVSTMFIKNRYFISKVLSGKTHANTNDDHASFISFLKEGTLKIRYIIQREDNNRPYTNGKGVQVHTMEALGGREWSLSHHGCFIPEKRKTSFLSRDSNPDSSST